jgi:dipeptidyl aminopeptidase/acylaminoacyl peptidase
MRKLFPLCLAAAMAAGPAPGFAQATAPAAGVDVAAFIKRDIFGDIKISPNGDYLAATVPMEDRTGMIILNRSTGEKTAAFALGKNTHVEEFVWVNPERVLISMSESFGQLDNPQLTGELVAVNADGKRAENLVGFRVDGGGAGTRIKPKEAESVWGWLLDPLADDDKYVLVTIEPFGEDTYTRAEKMDVYTGRRTLVARAPIPRARFTADNAGAVRFAVGAQSDNISKLYHRASDEAEWTLVNDEAKTGFVESAIGFSADNRTAYLRVQQPKGPDAIVAFDVASGERKTVVQDDNVDPYAYIYAAGKGDALVGAMLMDGKLATVFFDNASADARLYRSLEAAFAGQAVQVTSTTQDGKLALVHAFNDTNPGDFYIFNRETLKADHVISSRDWFDPAEMSPTEPFSLKSRDGLTLHGYLTRPRGATGKLPMVVLPHGGPFGVFDEWEFEDESQMLAQAGYAVLKVNFRGSGNYGRQFRHAGARQWGGTMQDDVTDATRWAIAQGIADPERICIYGGSYGAYASLVGVAREPDLYQCAVGYVGVYDLSMMHRQDSAGARSTRTWLDDWVGPIETLGPRSPTGMAARIKVPVFLAAGGEDTVAPEEHTKKMERALKAAGVPVESLYYATEGHGFYTESRRLEYYTKLLDFLSRHIGGAKATAAKAAP